jgi:activator of 2-hydroxyglutaryl-CoA dehydratase
MSFRSFQERLLGESIPDKIVSRCPVFMNSHVKQTQKEGVSAFDISACFSFSADQRHPYQCYQTT